MKRCLSVFVVVMMCFGTALAEENASPASGVTSLKSGNFSLDVTIPDAESGGIGGKYFITDSSALECGLLFNVQAEKASEGQKDGLATEVSAAYVYYLSNNRISPYIKGGGSLYFQTGDHYERTNEDDFGFLVLAGLGTEFFVTREFSISGEVQVKLRLSPTCYLRTCTPFLKASFYF